MNIKAIALALALGTGSSAMAAVCTSTSSLGTLGIGDTAAFGRTFHSAQSFNDCYNFTLSLPADTLGLTVEWDWSNALDIGLDAISLSGGDLAAAITDPTPQLFSFNGLRSGDYTLALTGSVSGTPSLEGVSYLGMIATKLPTIAAPVPEPETLAMLALGFAAVTWTSRRRR